MDRFFDRIKANRPVVRLNWNLMTDPALFQPRGHIRKQSTPVSARDAGDRLWLRVERQTLRRLPRTQDILFTIRILVRPLRDVAEDPDEATRLIAALRAVPPEVRTYKGLPRVIDAAIACHPAVMEYIRQDPDEIVRRLDICKVRFRQSDLEMIKEELRLGHKALPEWMA